MLLKKPNQLLMAKLIFTDPLLTSKKKKANVLFKYMGYFSTAY